MRVIFNDKPGFRKHIRTELWSRAPRSQTFWPQFVTHVSPYDKLGFRDTLLT